MDTQLKDVAARIRELRTIAGLTEAEMAEKTEVTEERYKVLEQGETDFGFTFIYKCAHVFGVEIKDLLEGRSPKLSLYNVTRSGEGLPIARKSGFYY
ncbi:MAG: helix-turn-helix transcriptional regulator [Clostridia bacterium]|nr:helix-turn-helix transcriptional regulator [Clostridia bacterium]